MHAAERDSLSPAQPPASAASGSEIAGPACRWRSPPPSAPAPRRGRSESRCRTRGACSPPRRMSSRSGSVNTAGSRLAAPTDASTMSPRSSSLPRSSIVSPGDAAGPLHRRVVAQQLLDRASISSRVLAQVAKLIRMPQQRQHAVADQVRRRLVPGGEQQHAVGEQLVRVQHSRLPARAGRTSRLSPGVVRRLLDDALEVSPHLLARQLRRACCSASGSAPAPRPSRPTTS